MGSFCKVLRRFLTVILAISCFVLAGTVPGHGAPDSVYTVSDVQVDVTADDAAQAREKAFFQAQEVAFRRLAEQLLSEAELKNFTVPEAAYISALIKDFEVTKEQLSHVRYIGTYTFRFKSADVRKYLGQLGVSYTDVGSKPLLVLPWYQWGSDNVLWGDNNPWLAAWAGQKSYRGLVPVTVPIGDLDDVADLGSGDALNYDPLKLARMAGRYGAGGTVIMLASPLWTSAAATGNPDALSVLVYRTENLQPELIGKLTVEADPDDPEGLFGKAVAEAHKFLEKDWKKQTIASPAEGNNLKARVRFSRMEEWIDTQKALRAVQGVNEVKLISLNPREAQVNIVFQGTEQRLRLALAQSDLTLSAPQVSFGAPGGGQSPLVYDLYMNKYRPAGTY